jgi:hypothetical protein
LHARLLVGRLACLEAENQGTQVVGEGLALGRPEGGE